MRNSLQINNGNGTYSEVGQLAGVDKTDWSWASLLADFNNDGKKDLIVTNGFRRDTKDVDYRKKYKAKYGNHRKFTDAEVQDILSMIPSQKISNYYFQNEGDLSFVNHTRQAGFGVPSFSNGASIADLDNDGDLDVVVNNLTEEAFLYRNNTTESGNGNFLRIKLKGAANNTAGLGAKVTITTAEGIQVQELTLTRGYQSAVENILHFGVAANEMVDKIQLLWPDGKTQELTNVTANQLLTLQHSEAKLAEKIPATKALPFEEITRVSNVRFKHQENDYDDYEKQLLLPHKMSQFGPALASGDVNGDGLDDFFAGGAAGQSGQLFLQTEQGIFEPTTSNPWKNHQGREDVGAVFFDADSDEDLDLYVVSGGYEFDKGSTKLNDRLYTNQGDGRFIENKESLPDLPFSGSCVVPGDFDADGDKDLFVGGRLVPGEYPAPASSYILQNDGGKFSDVTDEVLPELKNSGMISSAQWVDLNGDHKIDLVVAGEWMSPRIFQNKDASFEEITAELGLDKHIGWWNKVVVADFDGDGDQDLALGNLGTNYKYHATMDKPFPIYYNDFDQNGQSDIVLGYYNKGKVFPVRGRQCSSEQIPSLQKKFPTYKDFGIADISTIYGEALEDGLHYEATTFESCIIFNQGDANWDIQPLPVEAQFSAVFGMIPHDFTDDGNIDLLLAGNFYMSEVETGRADAGTGLLLKGDGAGGFEALGPTESGFFAPHDVRNLKLLNKKTGSPIIVVANNNDYLQLFRAKHRE